jgi:UDP-N-acetylmuramate dehydrogenase
VNAGVADGRVEQAAQVLGDRAVRDHPLAPLTTYRVGGAAALFVEASSVDDLALVAQARAASGLPVLVVGRGSNLLVADAGFVGIAVSVVGFADDISIGAPAASGAVVVEAGGGVPLPVLARRTAAAGVTGFEWAVGVPGSVGGGVKMNAGGHGSDMAASLVDVSLVDLAAPAEDPADALRCVEAPELGLGFRSSNLTDDHVVVSARLRLAVGDRQRSEREISEIVRWRREHQPGGQNCGSVFVNPVPGEVAAGALIDSLDLRGTRIGTAWVSEKHANFIQADDGGSADDVAALMELVRARVADQTGHLLRSEVKMVGFS